MPPPSPDARKIPVIYVDDEPALLEIGKVYLEKTKAFTVTTAQSAEKAIRLMQDQHFDAIISDYQMPGMDGIAFLKHLRSAGDTTPFIIFTGRGREEVVIQALNEGADFYIQKGGDAKAQFAELVHKIHRAVGRRRAEDALQESEERYRNVVETQSEFICRFLPDGTHLFVNEAYCRRFGKKAEELIGTRYKHVIHPDDQEKVTRMFASLTPDHPVGIIEHRIILPGNEVIWDRWITRAFFHDDGTVREYQSVGRDITELIEREQLIRESEKRFRRVMSLVPDLISIHDPEMTILYSNWTGFGEVSEERRQELTKCYRTYRDFDEICPDCQAQEVISTGKPFQREVLLSDGRWVDLRVIPVLDTDGNVEYFMEWVRDITERKRSESEVLEAHRLLEGMLDGIPDIVGLQLPDHTMIRYNKAGYEILGLTPEEVEGRRCYEIIGRSTPCENCATALAVASKRQETVVRYTPEFGMYLECTSRPILDEDGEIEMIIERLHDITDQKLAEEALRSSEERYRTLFEETPNPILVADASGYYMDANEAACAFLECTREELLTKSVWDFALPDQLERQRQEHTPFAAPRTIETDYLIHGMIKTLLLNVVPFEAGGETILYGIGQDITELKRKQSDIRDAREQYRSLVANIPGITFRCRYDRDWTMLYMSDAIEPLSGYPAGDFIGNAVRTYESVIHPDDTGSVAQNIQDAVESGLPWDIEYRILHRDGGIRWVHETGRAVLDADGDVQYLDGVILDITGRTLIGQQITAAEENQRILLDNIQTQVWYLTDDHTYGAVNEAHAAFNGIRKEDLAFKEMYDIFPAEVVEVCRQGNREVFSTGRPVLTEEWVPHVSGQQRLLSILKSPKLTPEGNVEYVVCSAEDITERRAAEEALHTANRKLRLLSGITRHDILNQIMILQGYLELSLPEIEDSKLSGYLSNVVKAATTIQKQIEFTRVYESLGVKSPAWQPLTAVIRTIDDSRLPIHHDCGEFSVYADPMFEKVLQNLYDNTIRHAEGADNVQIRCEEQDGSLVITWEDNGPGVQDDQKERIFYKGVGKNTGFGLFLAREILSITGIAVAETGVYGRGARFEIIVPGDAWQRGGEGR